MRRSLLALAITIAGITQLTTGALASAPGGWDHVGHGATPGIPALNGAVYALAADSSQLNLYAGGAFLNAGGVAKADYIAKWNGVAWHALSAVQLNGAVRAVAVHAGRVFVGGNFTKVGANTSLAFVAEWDGSQWSSPCDVTTAEPRLVTAAVAALQIIGNTLYIGGSFANGAGILTADYLLACDLTTRTPSATVPSDAGINGAIAALTADSNGRLYAGGAFLNLGSIVLADHVAWYKGGTWHAMDAGVTDLVRSLGSRGTDVYVGTDSVDIGGFAKADHVARWDGSAWHALGSNTAGNDGWFTGYAFIDAITIQGTQVFVAGSFQNANAIATADDIAYFDGTAWHPLGSNGTGNGPLNSEVRALEYFQLKLYAGGGFTNVGGDSLSDALASYWLLRPDVGIGPTRDGPFAGDDVYGATGAGETKTISVVRGHRGTLYAEVQNDGLYADMFKVQGTGAARGFTVSYFKGTTNVTAQVKAGTFSTGNLAPGASVTLKVIIEVAALSANTASFLIKATAPGDPPDAVKVTVHAH